MRTYVRPRWRCQAARALVGGDRILVDRDAVAGTVAEYDPAVDELLVILIPNGDPRSCTSEVRWFGTAAAAWATDGFAVSPTGLTGRSRECAA